MSTLPDPVAAVEAAVRKLVAETGFAAAHHNLRPQTRAILAALPDWIADPAQLARCEAVMLIGLHRLDDAAKRLATLAPDDCIALRELIANAQAPAPTI